MTSNEYVHLMLSLRSIGFGKTALGKTKFISTGLSPMWEDTTNDDGVEEVAKKAATKILIIDVNSQVKDLKTLQYFQDNAIKAVREAPINCKTAACLQAETGGTASYARHLFDVFYLYGIALASLNSTDPKIYNNLTALKSKLLTSFDGLTGSVILNNNLVRKPFYQVFGLTQEYEQTTLMNITYADDSPLAQISSAYVDESKTMWSWWNRNRPLATPICGFYLILLVASVVVLASLLIVGCIFAMCLIRNKKIEQERQNAEWQIPFVKLLTVEKKERGSTSKRSLQSTPSTITGDSKFSHENEFDENYSLRIYGKEVVLTTNHVATNLSKLDYDKFVKMRKLDHDNINKFIGLSIDGVMYVAVWKLCGRGSLKDIISKGNFSMDSFFMLCIIRDIAEGLRYLHDSFLKTHGNLRSATCHVNDSWQVKLTDFGLSNLQEEEVPSKRRLLWVAPEVIRGSLGPNQLEPSADVYSFAIIASEVLTKKEAWGLLDRKESVDEIIYQVKKGGQYPMRPDLVENDYEINVDLIRLVKECWSETPEDRPTTTIICKTLIELMPKTKTNLMDHVFNMLEEYTTTLELEVDDRTKELTLEKKKADILLGRMLPKQVAERLKAGQTVEPEGFDSVTVFFSDVVKFTQLAAKCSPFQVVTLLNDLYSNFDTIIEEHDAYKVESIGDGYLCVSGLPIRNGFAHIKQIVDMSLEFMSYVKKFKIPHLPREYVELRIGINSGPCVAGVVGLSMPRYCLFGDTVNTASRMESNGKASHIHMSSAAHSLLTSHYPHQYETCSRGEVIIKGKGVMETFWVLNRLEDATVRMATAVKGKILAVIGDEDTVVGFLLGGVGELNKARKPNYLIVDKQTAVQEIEDAFKGFCARDDISIILINQHIAEMIRYAVDQHTASIPAVLEIPSKEAPYDPSKDSILHRARGLFNPEDFR
ncbi:unnamed protein product [Caenorhabditis bovis]|uniref:Guanylate cyclase n=1 Tax=Caenorhabditis bovis TaxID=2654633 RepID=A0A8S1EYH4_9PELO|nr:unnamed protein product [Caenorhabditis bovis]